MDRNFLHILEHTMMSQEINRGKLGVSRNVFQDRFRRRKGAAITCTHSLKFGKQTKKPSIKK